MDAPTAASPVPPMDQHEVLVLAVFLGVYLGMALGRWPALAIDRTGIALCGAIVLLFFDAETGASAAGIDTGTLAVLFGLMVLSAQFAASGLYEWCGIGRAHVLTPVTNAHLVFRLPLEQKKN